ncbi:MAG: tRNA pseudouridine(55) synthase TruB [Bacteroidales bacterium]
MISKISLPEHPDFNNGEVLLIDKAPDWTSFDVVKSLKLFLKFNFGIKKIKIGHAGTLDPKATGLVIVCTGKKTKEIDSYQAREKEYTGTFRLGQTTPSYDTETQPDAEFPTGHIDEDLLKETTQKFLGEIFQVPPVFSAVKIEGRKAYEYARKSEAVKMRTRLVEIMEFEITDVQMPYVDFRVRCSKGTYIRSLAYDFGLALSSGAYLSALRRTAIGEFRVEDALDVQAFKKAYRSEG